LYGKTAADPANGHLFNKISGLTTVSGQGGGGYSGRKISKNANIVGFAGQHPGAAA